MLLSNIKRLLIIFTATIHIIVMTVVAVKAQPLKIISDAEIESLLYDYSLPILKASGLSSAGIDITLIDDVSLNAFVFGRGVFVNVGTLLRAKTPNQVIGIIAHEIGHLVGGHQERLHEQISQTKTIVTISALLGIGILAASSGKNNSSINKIAPAIAAGGAEFAKRSFLKYRRSEESAADNAAIVYLDKTGQSAKGLLEIFEIIAKDASFGIAPEPYLLTHPMPRDRSANIKTLAKKSKYWNKKDSTTLQERHDMARVKISAYKEGVNGLQRIKASLSSKIAKEYGDVYAEFLYDNPTMALKKTEALIKKRPQYAYFHELHGDILIKLRKPKQAAKAYEKARKFDKRKSPILNASHALALVAIGDKKSLKRAVKIAKQGINNDREYYWACYTALIQAYGALGNIGEAELISAEYNFRITGDIDLAKNLAARAQKKFEKNSPQWLRADDIIKHEPQ